MARKIDEINAINPDTLCILFDDMKGAVPSLASQQLRIMNQVTRQSNARHFIFCPTYYSDDPILARHFGEMPADYLEELGSHLDSRPGYFLDRATGLFHTVPGRGTCWDVAGTPASQASVVG